MDVTARFGGKIAASAFALALACGPAKLPGPPTTSAPASALSEVPYPPPPARVEFIPAKPKEGAVWIDGEWGWQGRRWGWTRGRWVMPPANGAYAPWTAVRSGDGVLYVAPGGWYVDGGAIDPPAVLVSGGDAPSRIVDANGTIEKAGATQASPRPPLDVDAGPTDRMASEGGPRPDDDDDDDAGPDDAGARDAGKAP